MQIRELIEKIKKKRMLVKLHSHQIITVYEDGTKILKHISGRCPKCRSKDYVNCDRRLLEKISMARILFTNGMNVGIVDIKLV